MKTTRQILIIVAVVIIIIQILQIDFTDPGWKTNRGNYLGIIAMLTIIAGMIYANILESKKKS